MQQLLLFSRLIIELLPPGIVAFAIVCRSGDPEHCVHSDMYNLKSGIDAHNRFDLMNETRLP